MLIVSFTNLYLNVRVDYFFAQPRVNRHAQIVRSQLEQFNFMKTFQGIDDDI